LDASYGAAEIASTRSLTRFSSTLVAMSARLTIPHELLAVDHRQPADLVVDYRAQRLVDPVIGADRHRLSVAGSEARRRESRRDRSPSASAFTTVSRSVSMHLSRLSAADRQRSDVQLGEPLRRFQQRAVLTDARASLLITSRASLSDIETSLIARHGGYPAGGNPYSRTPDRSLTGSREQVSSPGRAGRNTS
jgi:hypothetical protein